MSTPVFGGVPREFKVIASIGPAGEDEDVTALIDRKGIRIERTEDAQGVKHNCFLPFIERVGSTFDVQPHRLIRVYSTKDLLPSGAYMRLFEGYTVDPDAATPIGQLEERRQGINCVGMEIIEDFPPAMLVEWPDHPQGTPFVSTYIPANIAAGTSVVVQPTQTHDIYAGKSLFLSMPDLTTTERVTVESVNFTGIIQSTTHITSPGPWTFTVADTTGITDGMKLFVCQLNGHNPETITVTSHTGTTITATFQMGKSVPWLIMAGEVTLAEVAFAYTYTSTTVAAAITSGLSKTFTPASVTGLTVGQVITLANADGTAWEQTTITAISGGNVTADLYIDKTANWTLKVIPWLWGGITDKELIADGWQQEINGVMVTCDSMLDTSYTNATPAYAVEKSSIAEVIPSLPHLRFEAISPANVFLELRKYTPILDTTVAAPITSTVGLQWVTPVSMVGIVTNKVLTIYDADGSNWEQVLVTEASRTQFECAFTMTHAAGWHVQGDIIPRHYPGFNADNAAHTALWTYRPHWYDAMQYRTMATREFVDTTSYNPATQARFGEYQLQYAGTEQGTAITVKGSNFSRGYYRSDLAISGPPGLSGTSRCIELPTVIRTDLHTDDECYAEAKKIVLSRQREFASLGVRETLDMIDPEILVSPKWLSFTIRNEGTAILKYCTRVALEVSDKGVAKWSYTGGDPVQILGVTPFSASDVLDAKSAATYMHVLRMTADFTATRPGTTYEIDASSNNVTAYLPPSRDYPNHRVEFVRVDDGTSGFSVSIVAAEGETIT